MFHQKEAKLFLRETTSDGKIKIKVKIFFFFFLIYNVSKVLIFFNGFSDSGCITRGSTLGHRVCPFLWRWILEVTFFGFLATVCSVLLYLPLTTAAWYVRDVMIKYDA